MSVVRQVGFTPMFKKTEILWTAAFLNERLISVVSPLGWSYVGASFEQLALRDPLRYMGYPDAETIPATRLWQGHPYVNVEIFAILYKPFPNLLLPADAFRYFPEGDVGARRAAPYPRSLFDPRFLVSLLFHLSRDPIVTSPLNYKAWDRFIRGYERRLRALDLTLQRATDARKVLAVLDATFRLDAELLHIHRWSLTYADLFYKLLSLLVGDTALALMSRVPNMTRRVNRELLALGQMSPPPSAELIQKWRAGALLTPVEQPTANALGEFLDRHGHRAFSLDIAQPTYRDDPTLLLALMHAEDAPGSPAAPDASAAPLWVRPLVALARRYARLREDQRYYWQKSLALARRAYLVLGADLAARGILAVAEDIFYATRQEVTDYYGMELEPEELESAVARRKQEWQTYRDLDRARTAEAYPQFLHGDTPVREDSRISPREREWHGRGVSAGTVRGVARIVREPRGLGRVGAGEILIAPSTDPAWTPVFARLKGLVLERGGVLSHGAVVAREYHLPAVAAIPNVTRTLNDGEWIEVDGTNGVVRRLGE
jgi:pyruvate,water dikinase